MKRKLWFGLAVGLQLAILLLMILTKSLVLAHGTKVLLKTLPVDPWDLFRGEYVTLNYEISQLNLKELHYDGEAFKRNDRVYVALKKGDKYWSATSVSRRRPADESLFIKGTVRYYNDYDSTIFVTYGIESFFVPEGQGPEIEREVVDLHAEVSVDSRGNAALSRLFIRDKEINFR